MKRKYGTFKDRSNSEEYRRNLSNSLKGHVPWNKGLKGVQISTKKGKTFEEFFGYTEAEEIKERMKAGWTKEQKDKLSKRTQELWKDKNFIEKIKQAVILSNKDRVWTEEILLKRSLLLSGKGNGRYIDGRTAKWKKVRTQCFERDDYTCILCHKRGNVYLNSHHIINRHECNNIYDLNNLVTLCKNCHLAITSIEQTDSYTEYKDIFNLYIQKITK